MRMALPHSTPHAISIGYNGNSITYPPPAPFLKHATLKHKAVRHKASNKKTPKHKTQKRGTLQA
jgi:hypothetical protein